MFCVNHILFPTKWAYNCLHMFIILYQEYYYLLKKIWKTGKWGSEGNNLSVYTLLFLPSSLCISDNDLFLHSFNLDHNFKGEFLVFLAALQLVIAPAINSSALKTSWVLMIKNVLKSQGTLIFWNQKTKQNKKQSGLEERMSHATPHFMDEDINAHTNW